MLTLAYYSVAAKSTLLGDKATGGWSGFQGSSSAAGDTTQDEKKRKAENKESKKKKKKKPSTSPVAPRTKNQEVWSGAPADKLEGGWPEGWVKKKVQRQGGDTKGRADPYWYSPTGKKFRSMTEVKRFMAALTKANGDEERAWMIFKGKST